MTVVDSGTFPEPVEVEVDRRVWDLGARPDAIREAAKRWRGHADTTDSDIAALDSCDQDLHGCRSWASQLVDRYRRYRDTLDPQLESLRDMGKRVAAELDAIAETLQRHQRRLDELLSRLTARVPASDRRLSGGDFPHPTVASLTPTGNAAATGFAPLPPTHVVFQARSFDDLRLIEDSKAAAKQERGDVDAALATLGTKLADITGELAGLARLPGPSIPPPAPGTPRV